MEEKSQDERENQMEIPDIRVDRTNLRIMTVQFPDEKSFHGAYYGIGSHVLEGWTPTEKLIEIMRDTILHKITIEESVISLRETLYENQ